MESILGLIKSLKIRAQVTFIDGIDSWATENVYKFGLWLLLSGTPFSSAFSHNKHGKKTRQEGGGGAQESIPRKWFLGSVNVYKFGLWLLLSGTPPFSSAFSHNKHGEKTRQEGGGRGGGGEEPRADPLMGL